MRAWSTASVPLTTLKVNDRLGIREFGYDLKRRLFKASGPRLVVRKPLNSSFHITTLSS